MPKTCPTCLQPMSLRKIDGQEYYVCYNCEIKILRFGKLEVEHNDHPIVLEVQKSPEMSQRRLFAMRPKVFP